ncbi:hypothetical protein HBB16_09030 [Pseudonocardia sp. MCCB 268]|nr:hypothetical protein [Pseudonocardia cytotoxica]
MLRGGWEGQRPAQRSRPRTLSDESSLAKILVRGGVSGAMRQVVRFGRAARTDGAGQPVPRRQFGPGGVAGHPAPPGRLALLRTWSPRRVGDQRVRLRAGRDARPGC